MESLELPNTKVEPCEIVVHIRSVTNCDSHFTFSLGNYIQVPSSFHPQSYQHRRAVLIKEVPSEIQSQPIQSIPSTFEH